MSPLNNSEYLDLFLEEARDHLQNINDGLLKIEENNDDIDMINEVFRSAHTIKGMSATMGFERTAELTHKMENLLGKIREQEMQINSAIIDLLFESVDALSEMIENVAQGNEESIDISDIVAKLISYDEGDFKDTSPTIVKKEENSHTYKISLELSPDCVMKGARAFVVLNNLKEHGEIIKTEPQVEKLEKEDFDRQFTVFLTTSLSEEFIRTQLQNISEINVENISEIEELEEMKEKDTGDEDFILNEYDLNILKEAQKQGINSYKIAIQLTENCVMKSVRAFMVFKNLEEIGDIVKSEPSAQDIEDEKFDHNFKVLLLTDKSEEVILNSLEGISEIIVKEITPINIFKGEKTAEQSKQVEVQKPSKSKITKSNSKIHQTVRVDILKLDNLMNLVGELVINKTRLEQIFRTNDLTSLNETVEQIDRITSDLQNVVMEVRMVPIEQVFNRFPRMVRDLSKELGKKVNLIMEGKETELDRTVIDEIGDPLVHLIRNSMDHGIENPFVRKEKGKAEEGTLSLIARQEGNSVVIIVEDDGGGISYEKIKNKVLDKGIVSESEIEQMDHNSVINLIFSPGFSTAEEVTDVSGRGVGLDVVKSKINSLNGTVSVESKEGEGTRFTIKLPLTLAIIQALMVEVGKEIYAIPLGNIDETTRINNHEIKNIQGQEVMVLRGNVLPLLRLSNLLEVPLENNVQDELSVVVVKKGEQKVGLVVHHLIGQQEIVITSLGKLLAGIPGLSGAAILGDGTVSLILDVGTLF